MKKHMNKPLWAVYFVLGPVVLCALLSLIVCAIMGEVVSQFLSGFTYCYVLFGGWSLPYTVFFLVFRDDDIDLAGPFGAGLYYGTLVSWAALYNLFEVEEKSALAIGFIISALCCVIAWMSINKRK